MFRVRSHLLAPAVTLSTFALALLFTAACAADQEGAKGTAKETAKDPAAAAAAERPELAIGTQAPPLSLPGADGKTYTWEDYKDAKAVVVVFTCLSCPVARAYEERIVALARDYAPKGVKFAAIMSNDITIKPDDATPKLKARAEEMKYPFAYLVDSTQDVAKTYGAKVTPHVYIFGPDRKLVYRGRLDDNPEPEKVTVHDARNALDAIVAGKPVQAAETRAFGCSIKWKKETAS
jgi:peroxiredoxin